MYSEASVLPHPQSALKEHKEQLEQAVQEAGKAHTVMVAEALKTETETTRVAIKASLDEERQKSSKQNEELKVTCHVTHMTTASRDSHVI